MVPGPSPKNPKTASVRVDYLVHIEEIKPWPPSQSLRSLRSVLIQWENGDRSSGSTNTVVPSLGSLVGEGKIEFNESFRLPVTLLRDMSAKGREADSFQKNCLEFHLYEPRRDKAQLLATAVIDLSDYGVVKESLSISAPVNSKRSFRSTPQPMLYIKIQPFDKGRARSSSRDAPSKVAFANHNGGGSVSALMNEEYTEEADIVSVTDDDGSSHSSMTNGGLPPQNEENEPERVEVNKGGVNLERIVFSKLGSEKHISPQESLKRTSSFSSSVDMSSDLGSPVNGHNSFLNSPDSGSKLTQQKGVAQNGHQDLVHQVPEKVSKTAVPDKGDAHQHTKENTASPNNLYKKHDDETEDFEVNDENGVKSSLEDTAINNQNYYNLMEGGNLRKQDENDLDGKHLEEEQRVLEDGQGGTFVQEGSRKEDPFGSDVPRTDRLNHVKSVRSSSDSARSSGFVSRNHQGEVEEVSGLGDVWNSAGNRRIDERRNSRIYPKDTRTTILDSKVQQLESKIQMLEGELREAAAIEAALYSVIAEHGCSMSKVHAPARRLSRLYLHACRENSSSRRASAARSSVSGLILVAKACGNDVPRLTFWLSNSIVLRAIISQMIDKPELTISNGSSKEKNGGGKANGTKSSPLRWKELSHGGKNTNPSFGDFRDWNDPRAFVSALEKVEAWIFSRTIESIWWQTLTPHMQSAATNGIHRIDSSDSKNFRRTSSLVDEEQGNFSLDHWKKAFRDACERLCPLRAGGHECGCLPVLGRLIMEQCVARLDVAMFNAILRESADEIPTDPVSDPISDAKVLPIPAGTYSFGAGAQLKNAIGNWSRWLTDLFGIDDDDPLEDCNDKDENDGRGDISLKSFRLLYALSDLMMLPKDMLLSRAIRKEVCPTFGAPLIKRVLDSFVSDEFCPDPIPQAVLEALEAEDELEDEEESVTAVPCIAAPPLYLPPSPASITNVVGEFGSQSQLRRSGSSVLRKSYTSDDELDELNSPLAAILLDTPLPSTVQTRPSWKSKESRNQNAFRYELLRDVWMSSE
ncbi:hypothetical protein Tsubulata_034073 [Turnera subulata]|uniref:C2 NT-type domain-containing protein n=1 Tax=Turnera subulata TaxID=218843 RepID=A0A9Q0G3T2_9ROSI|nr:hypothetical protein Tsubulata_034073 [Turnera subulata]